MSAHFSTIRLRGRVILGAAAVVGTAVLGCAARIRRSGRLADPARPARAFRPAHIVRRGARMWPVLPERGAGTRPWSRWARWEWLVRAERLVGRRRRRSIAPPNATDRRPAQTLRAMPRQVAPSTDAVDLTPAERAAFAGLMRQFSQGHR